MINVCFHFCDILKLWLINRRFRNKQLNLGTDTNPMTTEPIHVKTMSFPKAQHCLSHCLSFMPRLKTSFSLISTVFIMERNRLRSDTNLPLNSIIPTFMIRTFLSICKLYLPFYILSLQTCNKIIKHIYLTSVTQCFL